MPETPRRSETPDRTQPVDNPNSTTEDMRRSVAVQKRVHELMQMSYDPRITDQDS